MTLSIIAIFTAVAIAGVFAGGAFFASGMLLHGIVASAIGAGWLGILYSTLLRMAADATAKKPA